MKLPVYTIGHGNRSIEDFTGLLKIYEIKYLVDVRSKPYSAYNTQYIRENLKASLKENNIVYVYMGDVLGGRPANPVCYTNGRVDYNKVKEMPFYKQGIERLKTAYAKDISLAIMCAESNPCNCHRSKLISTTLTVEDIEVVHIDEKGCLKTHDAVVKEIYGDMPISLFNSQ